MKTNLPVIAKYISANALSSLLAILSYPLIARFYGPSVFGEYAQILSWLTVFCVLSSLRIESILSVPRTNIQISGLVAIGLISSALSAFSSVIFCLIFLNFREVEANYLYGFAVGAYVFFYGAFQILQGLLIRRGETASASRLLVCQAACSLLLQLILGLVSPTEMSLLLAIAISFTLPVIFYCRPGRSRIKFYGGRNIAISWKRYGKFIISAVPQGIINGMSMGLWILFVGRIGGDAVAGIFAMAQRLMMIPIRIISTSIRTLLVKDYVNSKSKERCGKILFDWTARLALMWGVIFIPAAIISPYLAKIFLGPEWDGISHYIVLLLPWSLGVFIYTPAVSMKLSQAKAAGQLIYEVINLIVRAAIGTVFLVGTAEAVHRYVALTSGLNFLVCIIFVWFAFVEVKDVK